MIAYQLFEGVPPFYTLDPVEAARAAALEHKRPQWGANKKGVVSVIVSKFLTSSKYNIHLYIC